MLTRLRIVNIQKHKDLDLSLEKINVIVGATDSGKTSVLRALTWALTNDASGEGLITNDGSKSCSVSVTTENGTVTRSWSRSKNGYSLDGKTFTTFRSGVPKPIEDLLNIKDINIQRRRDMPFMVYFKDSECASQFSDMMDLSEIDTIITSSNASVKQRTSKVEQLKERKAEIDSELEGLSGLDDAVQAYKELRTLQRSIKEYSDRLNALKTLQKQHSAATYEFSRVTDPADAECALNTLKAQCSEHTELGQKLEGYLRLLSDWHDAASDVDRYSAVSAMLKDAKSLDCRTSDIRELQNVVQSYEQSLTTYNDIVETLKYAKHTYNTLLGEFKRTFPSLCPLCGKASCDD